jgi:hypothetical protein
LAYAQTVAALNGKSGLRDPDGEFLRTDSLNLSWPNWKMVDEKNFYRTQAHWLLELELSEDPRLVKVFEDRISMANFPGGSGRLSYAKSQDYDLVADRSRTLKKDVVFTAYLERGDTATFAVPVYRANYYNLDYPLGIAAIMVAIFGTIGLVKARGKRFEFR